MDRNAKRHFWSLKRDRPVPYDRVQLDSFYPAASLVRVFGVEPETLRQYNPALRPAVWNGSKYLPRGYDVLLPVGTLSASAEVLLAQVPSEQRFSKQHRDRYYKGRRGDTLYAMIAGPDKDGTDFEISIEYVPCRE